MARALGLGQAGGVETTPQYRDEEGKWKTHPTGKGKGVQRWRARAYYRGQDGILGELSRVHAKRLDAIAACEQAVDERLRVGAGTSTSTQPLTDAGAQWLALIGRSDSGLSARTVDEYGKAYRRFIDAPGSRLRGLTLTQANDPARIRAWLQNVADQHGTGSAKLAKSVLSGILGHAVNDGVLSSNATRQVRPVKQDASGIVGARGTHAHDTKRAFTRDERSVVMAYADEQASDSNVIGRTVAKRKAVADLTAFMAGTGVRISEARGLRWEHVNLSKGYVNLHGTKTKGSRRRLDLPVWLTERLAQRHEANGGAGYVFASPASSDGERMWEQANCANAMAGILRGAGFGWAIPHTFRRTVATLLSESGMPIARIADQLGHADPAMTASVYLGRDFDGDKSDLAAAL